MKKVLIVNDCRFESIIIRDKINALGYTVKITNEYGAIREIKEFSPNIVIANLIMKDTTGDELIERIRKIDSNIYGILSSCNPIYLDKYKSKGVDDVIQTPVDIAVLKKVLTPKNEEQEGEKQKSKISFCPYCGEKLEVQQFKFCPYCGNKLNMYREHWKVV